jgi:hypothetical protein
MNWWRMTDSQIQAEAEIFMSFLTTRRDFIAAAAEWFQCVDSISEIAVEMAAVQKAIEAEMRAARATPPAAAQPQSDPPQQADDASGQESVPV